MKPYYLIILVLLFPLITWASPIDDKELDKDTIATPAITAPIPIATHSVSINHLSDLQQTLRHKKNVLGIGHRTAAPTMAQKFRAFPTLDVQEQKQQDFSIPMANRVPEFTSAYFEENIPSNPRADSLIAKAKAAFDAVKELENFAEIKSHQVLSKIF